MNCVRTNNGFSGPGLASCPVQKVFALEELLQPILTYAASKESQNFILSLRLVCQNWKKVVFKLLTPSPPIPAILDDPKRLATLTNALSPDCLIPIQVFVLFEATKKLSPAHLDFLQKYAVNIVQIEFRKVSDVKLVSKRRLLFRFPNLRRLEVKMPYDLVYYSADDPLHSLIGSLVDGSPRLDTFKIHLDLEKVDNRGQLSPKVTRLEVYFSDFPDLEEIFAGNDFGNLKVLELYSLERLQSESGVLTEIVNRFGGTLQVLKLSFPQGTVSLTLKRTKNLQEICLFTRQICLTAIEGSSLSEVLPNLKSLQLRGQVDSKAFSNRGMKFERLEALSVSHRDEESEETEQAVKQLLIRLIPASPNLKTFSWKNVSSPVGAYLLPHVFAQLTKLISLDVSLKGNAFSRLLSADLCQLLTGFEAHEIPQDESLWPQYLEGKVDSIRNLMSLQKLKIAANLDCNRPCHLPRFVFKAALLQMPSLKCIECGGSLTVDEIMKNAWRCDQSRTISSDSP